MVLINDALVVEVALVLKLIICYPQFNCGISPTLIIWTTVRT